MKYFDTFAGVGGFSLGIERAYDLCRNVNTAEKTMDSTQATNQNVGCVCGSTKQSGDSIILKKAERQGESSTGNTDRESLIPTEENVSAVENRQKSSLPSTMSMKTGISTDESTEQEQCTNCASREGSPIPTNSSATTATTQKEGMESAPICVGMSEVDKHALAVLRHNYPNVKQYGDISKINWSEVPDFDLLTGGSPCQDFSIAGKRAGLAGARSGLFAEYIRALKEKKPKYFIFENVKGMLSSRQGWDFANVQVAFSEAGYNIWWQVLNAKDFGVPQNRERIFVVGTRNGSPREVLFETGNSGQNLKEITKGQSQGNRIYNPDGIATTIASQAGGLGAKTGLYAIDLSTQETKITDNVRTIQARYHKGYSNRKAETSGVLDVRAVLTPNRVNKRQNGRRMKDEGEPMFTLTGQDIHGVATNSRIRRLTPTECELLMSWPNGWTASGDFGELSQSDCGNCYECNDVDPEFSDCTDPFSCRDIEKISDTQRYKMCGNGVVSNCVEAIVRNLIMD